MMGNTFETKAFYLVPLTTTYYKTKKHFFQAFSISDSHNRISLDIAKIKSEIYYDTSTINHLLICKSKKLNKEEYTCTEIFFFHQRGGFFFIRHARSISNKSKSLNRPESLYKSVTPHSFKRQKVVFIPNTAQILSYLSFWSLVGREFPPNTLNVVSFSRSSFWASNSSKKPRPVNYTFDQIYLLFTSKRRANSLSSCHHV